MIRIAKNASDIRNMMQAAYDERQRSQDYIDHLRTGYIRGETDWISNIEGGTVYHTDSWGTRNTATGEYFEGQPYNYVNFEGQNPKYNEQMTEINNRQLYDQVFGHSRCGYRSCHLRAAARSVRQAVLATVSGSGL